MHFTSSDSQAALPASSTLTNGTGTFSATLKTSGNRTITATDTVSNSITGTSSSIAVSAAAATHLAVSAPASATAGTAFSFTVTALDAFNNATTAYSATVHFSSSDIDATLPANSTLTNGSGTFSATLRTSGNWTVTVNDTVTASISGTSAAIAVGAAAGIHLVVSAPAGTTAGSAFSVAVTAFDPFNNVVTAYGGTVHFTSSDAQAVLPANSMLTNGSGTFSATLETSGNQTITATDTVSSSVTGTSNSIAVSAAAAMHVAVSAPATETAGTAFTFTVTALDPFNNTAIAYPGTVHFASSDSAATLSANSTLTNGTGAFSATLRTSGNQTISATDTASAAISGTSAAITVNAASGTHLMVSAPANASAGSAFNVTVTAFDSLNNVATAYGGTVHFTSSDAQAVLPSSFTLTNGSGTFAATLKSSGDQTITATDSVSSSINGSSNTIVVTPAVATHLALSAPAGAAGNVAFNVLVTALDAFNNTATAYTGTLHFTSSDAQAMLPANATLINGAGNFPATLKTAGSQTITATDTVSPSVSGTSSAIGVSTQADLAITKSGPATANPGSNLSYTIRVMNNGPSDAQSVVMLDDLPSGTTFVSLSQTAGPAFSCTTPAVGAAGTVSCTIATLVSGGDATFTLVLQTAGANVSNTATVTSATPDPSPANNSATSTTEINTADVSITQTGSAATPYGGFDITYIPRGDECRAGDRDGSVGDRCSAGGQHAGVGHSNGSLQRNQHDHLRGGDVEQRSVIDDHAGDQGADGGRTDRQHRHGERGTGRSGSGEQLGKRDPLALPVVRHSSVVRPAAPASRGVAGAGRRTQAAIARGGARPSAVHTS